METSNNQLQSQSSNIPKLTWLLLFVGIWITDTVAAQDMQVRYNWFRTGLPVYKLPDSESEIVDSISYGYIVKVLEFLQSESDTVIRRKEREYSYSYVYDSQWIKVKEGYIKDTYLSSLPAPLFSEDGCTDFITDYLKSLSSIKKEIRKGASRKYCEYHAIIFKNGTRYSYKDFGPCESCGQSLMQVYMPGVSQHEAFLLFSYLIGIHLPYTDLDSTSEETGHPNIERQGASIRLTRDISTVTITPKRKGTQIEWDVVL